ncbi:MAG: hypothetical protein AABY36_01275 [Campylobacterota bacterium]
MKTIILLITLTLGALQADGIVHYDVKESQTPISKPNHPSSEIY